MSYVKLIAALMPFRTEDEAVAEWIARGIVEGAAEQAIERGRAAKEAYLRERGLLENNQWKQRLLA